MISHFCDFHLRPLVSQCASYVRDTTDFLSKISSITNLPKNTILVTADVNSLYTVIDHQDGIDAVRRHLESSKSSRSVPGHFICGLLNLILTCNYFRFENDFFLQKKGTAMGTPTAPNFANLFMAEIENKMLQGYEQKTGKKPLVWLRFLDDIFFIWTHGEEELTSFIQYMQDYSESMKIKTTLKYDIHYSTQCVNFLDTTIKLENGQLSSDL